MARPREGVVLITLDNPDQRNAMSDQMTVSWVAAIDELAAKALELWQKRGTRWLGELSRTVKQRHAKHIRKARIVRRALGRVPSSNAPSGASA